MAVKQLFFDLDGTLIDISEKYYRIYADFMGSTGRRPRSKQWFWSNKRKKAADLIGDRQFFIDRIEHPDYLQFDKLFPFSLAVLSKLVNNGHRVYVVTLRQNRRNLLKQIKNLKIDRFVKVLTTAPLPFQSSDNHRLKIRLLKPFARPGDVVVGDSRADILAGRALKLTKVAVLSGISNYKILKTYAPDYVVHDIRSLVSLM